MPGVKDALEADKAAVEEQLAAIVSNAAEHKTALAEARTKLQDRDHSLASLQQKLAQLEEHKTALEAELESSSRQYLVAASSAAEEKLSANSEILRLNAALSDSKGSVRSTEAKVEEAIALLHDEHAKNLLQVAQLEASISSMDQQV